MPFGEGYRHAAGLIENIQSMTVPIVPDRYEPLFREVKVSKSSDLLKLGQYVDINSTGELSPSATAAPDLADALFGPDPGRIRLFTNGHPADDVRRALKAGKLQLETSKPNYLAYNGWRVSRKAVRLPFSLIVASSVLIAFIGVVLLIFTQKRTN